MPVTPTYPGVYIEEVPSGVRTIAGVATSITAFVGQAARGLDNKPVVVNNYGDFERNFGGLGINYPMSYAVRDFFLNGGGQALIVRLYGKSGTAPTADLDANGLMLEAASKGKWGNELRARIDHKVSTDMPWVKANELTEDDLFNLTVFDGSTGVVETFVNMTVSDSPRRVDRVLESGSHLVRAKDPLPGSRPADHADLTTANRKALWTDDTLSSPINAEAEDSPDLEPTDYTNSRDAKTGLYALEKADLFNMLCIPPDSREGYIEPEVYSEALTYCVERRAMLIVDPRAEWKDVASAISGLDELNLSGLDARNAVLYFPRVEKADPLRENQTDTFVPCGLVAGAMARTDAQRGVWKAPAGIDVSLNGIRTLSVSLTNDENGQLNPLGINCLRTFPVIGNVIWGARTLRGADLLADEYKYVPVRRLALFIEESLYRGTQWVVFEPNDEPLWAQIRLNIGAFMHNLFRQGAFQGSTPREAYLVKCDKETTTQNDINLGIVNIVVGFAPLKPAEFVIIKIQQLAGQIDS
jgi:uncharacterized protein